MKKIISIILIAAILILVKVDHTCAEDISFSSASLKTDTNDLSFDYRVENLRKFFQKYNSPLAVYAEEFVKYADQNDLDYRLIPAITGVESTFGKRIPSNSYNAYGWANGNYKFESWEDSISHVAETLRSKYMDRGINTIPEIARVYAPPSATWANKVSFFVKKIDTLPFDFDLI